MPSRDSHPLDRLFYPRSVAMVGASPKRGRSWSSGNSYIVGSIKHSFPGNLYPVHPSAKTVLGYKAYANIRDLPEPVDLVIFTIPTRAALQVMEDCVANGVKFVHLLTAGFTETGRPEHADMERELLSIARKGGIRIVGPNCMGLYCPEGGLAWNDEFPEPIGPIGFFSQSGQLASHFIIEGAQLGLTFSKVVSFGNAVDLQAHEFLEYFAQDDEIKVMGAYLEGLKDGRAFFEAARRITPVKPLVVWKGGQTEGGARATRSHTAAVAGSSRIWQALCRQAGIIPVNSMDEARYTVAALLSLDGLPGGVRAAILGGAGGGSVTMTDLAEREGLKVPHLSANTVSGIETFVPIEGHSARNPLDIDIHKPEHFYKLMELLRDDENIDIFMYSLHFRWVYRDQGRAGVNSLIQQALKAREILGKPVFMIVEPEGSLEMDLMGSEAIQGFQQAGLPTFNSFEIAARVICKLDQYRRFKESNSRPEALA